MHLPTRMSPWGEKPHIGEGIESISIPFLLSIFFEFFSDSGIPHCNCETSWGSAVDLLIGNPPMGDSRSFSSCPPLLCHLSIAKYFSILLSLSFVLNLHTGKSPKFSQLKFSQRRRPSLALFSPGTGGLYRVTSLCLT